MHTGCVIPVVTFVTLDCVVLVVYLLSTGATWVVLRRSLCDNGGLVVLLEREGHDVMVNSLFCESFLHKGSMKKHEV